MGKTTVTTRVRIKAAMRRQTLLGLRPQHNQLHDGSVIQAVKLSTQTAPPTQTEQRPNPASSIVLGSL